MRRMWAALAVLVAAGMLIAGCPSTPENKNPTAGMTIDKYILFVGGSVGFDASASKDSDGKVKEYYWNFGDGTPSQTTKEKNATHAFTTAGAFSITLQVKDDKGGRSKTINDTVVVAPMPTASKTTVDTQTNITFSVDTGSLGGRVTDFSWSFGDGTPAAKNASATHAYADNGTFKATLTLGYKGQTAASSLDITVTNQPPKAVITVGSVAPYFSNKPITFNSASGDNDGNVTKEAWDFGDNTTGENKSVTHSYKNPGTFTVKLTVTDNDGATNITLMTIEVAKDLIIKSATVTTFVDPTNHTRGKVEIKIENKGDAKGPGTIRINVTSYKADKSVSIDTNSTTNGGTWEPNTAENSITVSELLTDGFDADGTYYKVEVFFQDGLIDSGWYKK